MFFFEVLFLEALADFGSVLLCEKVMFRRETLVWQWGVV